MKLYLIYIEILKQNKISFSIVYTLFIAMEIFV
jgi:hypothetical protein